MDANDLLIGAQVALVDTVADDPGYAAGVVLCPSDDGWNVEIHLRRDVEQHEALQVQLADDIADRVRHLLAGTAEERGYLWQRRSDDGFQVLIRAVELPAIDLDGAP